MTSFFSAALCLLHFRSFILLQRPHQQADWHNAARATASLEFGCASLLAGGHVRTVSRDKHRSAGAPFLIRSCVNFVGRAECTLNARDCGPMPPVDTRKGTTRFPAPLLTELAQLLVHQAATLRGALQFGGLTRALAPMWLLARAPASSVGVKLKAYVVARVRRFYACVWLDLKGSDHPAQFGVGAQQAAAASEHRGAR